MKNVVTILTLNLLVFNIFLLCNGLENFLSHPLYQCIICLCHAKSGCWNRLNCAKYSITKTYWEKAGSLTPNTIEVRNNLESIDTNYRICMENENCIVGTIIKYTENFGNLDCNCDGHFDCKDRAAVHLFGRNCERPKFGKIYASRFNHCAREIGVNTMLTEEGDSYCTVPEAV